MYETARVQTFSPEMIACYLNEQEYNYLTDKHGNFIVHFAHDDAYGAALTMGFYVEGKEKTLYYLRCTSTKRVPRADWPRAMELCNSFNQEYRWPKAFLLVTDADGPGASGEIVLEHNAGFASGVHQELLNELTDDIVGATSSFWHWAAERGL